MSLRKSSVWELSLQLTCYSQMSAQHLLGFQALARCTGHSNDQDSPGPCPEGSQRRKESEVTLELKGS